MEIKRVLPFKHNGQNFMPYPERKPRDGAKLLILTQNHVVHSGAQMPTKHGRRFLIGEEGQETELHPKEILGWWYKEPKPEKSLN